MTVCAGQGNQENLKPGLVMHDNVLITVLLLLGLDMLHIIFMSSVIIVFVECQISAADRVF